MDGNLHGLRVPFRIQRRHGVHPALIESPGLRFHADHGAASRDSADIRLQHAGKGSEGGLPFVCRPGIGMRHKGAYENPLSPGKGNLLSVHRNRPAPLLRLQPMIRGIASGPPNLFLIPAVAHALQKKGQPAGIRGKIDGHVITCFETAYFLALLSIHFPLCTHYTFCKKGGDFIEKMGADPVRRGL